MAIQLVYSERDIEDILCLDCHSYLGLRFIGRQVQTPVGIIDILAVHPRVKNVYYVIEIKRGKLDASAFVQAFRYTSWLNSEYSSNCRRVFIPILIGESLADDLVTVCDYFDTDHHNGKHCFGSVCYRLFHFSPVSGVSFDWHSPDQRKHRDGLYHVANPILELEETAEWLRYQLRQSDERPVISSPPQSSPALVK